MNIEDAFPSKYLKASDLEGKQWTVTMTEVKTEEVGRDKEPKAVLYLKGTNKGIVLNKGNARILAEAFGKDTNDWFGQKITLYEAQTEFQGKRTTGLRVEIPSGGSAASVAAQRPLDPPPQQPKQNYAGDLDDDIPF